MYVYLHLAISTFSFQAHVKYTEVDGVLAIRQVSANYKTLVPYRKLAVLWPVICQ